MKKLFVSLSCAIIAVILLCGCGIERVAMDPVGYKSIRQGGEITEEEAAQIIDGKTTKDDVYLMFGEPSNILEDGRVFIYSWIRGTKANLLGLGSGSAKAYSLIITFDGNRVVKGHRITRGEVSPEIVTDTTIGD